MTTSPTASLASVAAIGAIHRGALAEHVAAISANGAAADGDECHFATAAEAVLARVARSTAAEAARLADALQAAGVPTGGIRHDSPQRHALVVDVADHAAAAQVATVLAGAGYARDHVWRGGAERSFWRVAGEVRLTRSDDVTHVVRVRWEAPRKPGALARALHPTPADWDVVPLPGWAWWAYPLVRPLRLAAERVGLRSADHGDLEPFLATPRALIPVLLEAAAVTDDDLVLDLGCGDGRIVIDTARATSCRAVGVERDAELARAAAAAVHAAGLTERVRIVHGDGTDLPLDDVTVVLLFLPATVLRHVLPDLLARLRPGARVLAHEQSGLPPGLPRPSRSLAAVADEGVTVIHRWDVSRPRDAATP